MTDNQQLNRNWPEKRRYKRVSVQISVSVFYMGDFFIAQAIEVSEGGLLLELPQPIKNQSHFEICCALGDKNQFTLIQCESVYTLNRNEKVYTGVRFLSLTDTARDCLKKLTQT